MKAKLRVSLAMIERALFGNAPVVIVGIEAGTEGLREAVLEVTSPLLPEGASEVSAIVTEELRRRTVTFAPVERREVAGDAEAE
jgi:hypothetical protein